MLREWSVILVQCFVHVMLLGQTGLLIQLTVRLKQKFQQGDNRHFRSGSLSPSPPTVKSGGSLTNLRTAQELCRLRPKNFELFTGAMVWLSVFMFVVCTIVIWASIIPSKSLRMSCTSMVYLASSTYQVCFVPFRTVFFSNAKGGGSCMRINTQQISKTIMYTLFLMRVESTFLGTMHAYDTTLMAVFIAITILVSLGLTLSQIITGIRGYRYCSQSSSVLCLCGNTGDSWFFAGVLLLEVIVTISALYLFTKPLRKVLSLSRHSTEDSPNPHSDSLRQSNLKLKKLIVKYTLTTLTAIASTLFAVILVGVLGISELTILDSFINSVCLMFVTSWFDDHFEMVFSVPIWFGRHCCGLEYQST